MLEAGKKGIHLRQGSAVGGFQLFDGGDVVGKGLLEGEGWEWYSKFLNDLHIQPWHYGSAFSDAQPMLNFCM